MTVKNQSYQDHSRGYWVRKVYETFRSRYRKEELKVLPLEIKVKDGIETITKREFDESGRIVSEYHYDEGSVK